jgi:DegV family protein with EDD domain
MLKIVTDGSADMPEEWINHYGIHILPLNIRFGEETYVQGVDISPAKFYRLVQQKRIIPQTSLPSPQQVMDFYRKLAAGKDRILSIHLASKLSGTFSIIQMAAKDLVGELQVTAYDSGAGSAALGFMCREARLMDNAGASIQDIINKLERIRKQLIVIFTVDNLEFARLSGRVNMLQSTLASVLRIKPVILLRDGLLFAADKVRTRQHALDHILEAVRERVGERKVEMAIVHAADPETARSLIDRAKKIFNIRDLIMTDLSIPVAAHLGPGTVGIVAYPVEE